MITTIDNFNYQGKKPNFERDSYDTLEAMKNVSETVIDDGHIAFNKEDRQTYKYDSTNASDNITGKWRLLNGISFVEVDELEDDYTIPANPSKNFEIIYYITVGDTVHNIIGDSSVIWQDGTSPQVEANCIILVSIINNLAVWGKFK